jgi:hypothetical protein
MTTDEEKGRESELAKAAVILGAVIGAVVFGWLGYRSSPPPLDIEDAYDAPIRMFFGLIVGFVIGGIVGFGGVMAGLVACDLWARRGRWISWPRRNPPGRL